jgi:hypothetical protein
MVCMRGLVLLIVIAVLVVFSSTGNTQITPIVLKDGRVTPANHAEISLRSEQVIIRLKEHSYVVDAVFQLFNHGDITTVWVGIPKPASGPAPWSGMPPPSYRLIRLDTWIDGKNVAFSLEQDGSSHAADYMRINEPKTDANSRWLVRQITFNGHKITLVRISYAANYRTTAAVDIVRYNIGIALNWKDKIGKASFIVDSAEVSDKEKSISFRYSSIHRQRKLSDNVVRYELANFSPHPAALLSIYVNRSRKQRDK